MELFNFVSTLSNAAQAVSGFVVNIVDISCILGYLIVQNLVHGLQLCSTVFSSIVTFLKILCEDYYYFLTDISNLISCTKAGVSTVLLGILNKFAQLTAAVAWCLTSCATSIFGTFNLFLETVSNIFYFISHTLHLLFGSITFIGNSTVNIVFLVPYIIKWGVDSSIKLVVDFLLAVYESVYNSVVYTTETVTSISTESYISCLVGLVLSVSTVLHFKIIVRFIANVVFSSLTALDYILTICWTGEFFRTRTLPYSNRNDEEPPTNRTIQVPSRNDEPTTGGSIEENSPAIINRSHLCLVCLDKPKNVLYLPCRHVCVCSSCNIQFITTCPLCRKKITKTIVIYV